MVDLGLGQFLVESDLPRDRDVPSEQDLPLTLGEGLDRARTRSVPFCAKEGEENIDDDVRSLGRILLYSLDVTVCPRRQSSSYHGRGCVRVKRVLESEPSGGHGRIASMS